MHRTKYDIDAPDAEEAQDSGATTLQSPTAIVHLEYDVSNPPPIPSSHWTRFVCISDTHSHSFPVPPGDVLLHSGDLTAIGTTENFRQTVDWLVTLPHRNKIIIAGNHDLPLDCHGDWYDQNYKRWSGHNVEKQDINEIYKLLQGNAATEAGIVYLEDKRYEFKAKDNGRTWSVYGSPWTPNFYSWAFNYDRGEQAEKIVSAFPKADILLTHGPPHNIFDEVLSGDRVGCESLAAALPTLRPKLHVFGHIHESHGALIREWKSSGEGDVAQGVHERTVFVNAANWPMGRKAARVGGRVPFGEGPFQPVIVDLIDKA